MEEKNKDINYDNIVNYGYYNSEHEYCIVLNLVRLKEIFKADKIYLEEPKDEMK